ncbi:MAG: DUF6152 family protein [Steroidobacteraceae bacterium]
MKRSNAFAVGASLALLAPVALAHHGWAGQGDENFELTGTVEKPVSLAGPHATMKVRSQGQVWDITLAPPPRTEAAGLKPETLKVGDAVTVSGHRNRDAKRNEIKTERVTVNGKLYNVYPDRD